MTPSSQSPERPFRERYSFLIILCLLGITGLAFYTQTSESAYRVIFFKAACIAWALMGLDIIAVNLKGRQKALSSTSWPTVNGTLLEGKAVRRRYGQKDQQRYFLEIQYRYTLAGKTFESDNYNWVGVANSSEESIVAIIDSLRNQPFSVYYNPDKHSESVIKPEVSWIYYLGALVGLVIILLATLGFVEKLYYLQGLLN